MTLVYYEQILFPEELCFFGNRCYSAKGYGAVGISSVQTGRVYASRGGRPHLNKLLHVLLYQLFDMGKHHYTLTAIVGVNFLYEVTYYMALPRSGGHGHNWVTALDREVVIDRVNRVLLVRSELVH